MELGVGYRVQYISNVFKLCLHAVDDEVKFLELQRSKTRKLLMVSRKCWELGVVLYLSCNFLM